MEIENLSTKFKIIIIIVLILSTITFAVFMNEKELTDKQRIIDEEQRRIDNIEYRKISDTTKCDFFGMIPYNETHCVKE